jgi:thiol-disulfide isomerase/thioredoxin
MSNTVITLYTRKGCHLCDDAKQSILELKKNWNFIFEEMDIDQSDELTEQYGLLIPVVMVDGEEASSGIFDYLEIRERLQKKREVF